ncbi:GFA family protein [Pseudoalteromonas sp. HL-AS1]|uniref:GFA family protein n=1 Tax=Pseudoalteromonas sp. HL-AS1 TaxID=3071081 RepID=UPI0028153BDF|nr:GFA family protein [Pseudoalteromonas sp. HL-AS1]WMS91520.1 GFA family protein [Pseudoalteromonas sp. HL-AS1]
MEITGSCYCGEIKYQAKSQNNNALVCHCSDCQRMSSDPFRAVIIAEPNSVVFTQSEPKEFVKTAQSGNKRAQGFCGTCGTTLYATNEAKADRVYGLRIGAVDQRDQFTPTAQIWAKSTLSWLSDLHEVPAFDTTPQN